MTTQRGLTLLSGSSWSDPKGGKPRAFLPVGEDVRVSLHNDGRDRARVRDALRPLDELSGQDPSSIWLFMLSYEACVALDKRTITPQPLPRKSRDPSLGPDVIVRRCTATAMPKHKALRIVVPLGRVAPGAREAHIARVAKAKEALLDGVIYQANLAHRIDMPARTYEEGLTFFLARTQAQSAPCPPSAAFVDVPGFGSLVSLSPERFIDLEKNIARAFPIKGTRPRGKSVDEDAQLKAELIASEKDAAEHVMIVDLLRNDLGKVARPGSVTVERLLDVVSVPNVHHLESTVTARIDNGVALSDLIEATVPGGSITGAPKSSAIEIIHALEDGPRGPYTGVLGIVETSGAGERTLRSSLLIRTWIRPDDDVGALHVGGGIVVDSEPENEWQETLHKAAAFG